MTEPFLSEIRLFSFNFPPKGWALCNGQFLPINQNQPLFALLGTVYGGNGQTTFALPDLRGRVPVHMGSGVTLGQKAGEEFHTLSIGELPQHIHFMQANNAAAPAGATATPPVGNSFATANAVPAGGGSTPVNRFGTGTPDLALAAATIAATGGSQPHENRQPFLTMSYCIALQGIFPSQT